LCKLTTQGSETKIRFVTKSRKNKNKFSRLLPLIIIGVVVVVFAVLWFVTRPSGRLEVMFNKELDFNVRSAAIDSDGKYCFFGGSNSTFLITDDQGTEIAKFQTGKEILELITISSKRLVVARCNPLVECYTYNGKLSWSFQIQEYYPDVVQVLARSRVGVYMRSLRGEKPIVAIIDSETGKPVYQQKLDIEARDIMPAFTQDGEKIVFEIQPGVVGMVKLAPDLPIVWQTHLNTKNGRFSTLDVKVSNSNLVVCSFTRDGERLNEKDNVANLFVIDGNRELPKKSGEVPEMPLLWTAEVQGSITYMLLDPTSDNIMVQAGQVYLYNRTGKVLAHETDESYYAISYIGSQRYVTSFFLDDNQGRTVQFSAHGIGREGVLWRYTINQSYILPVFTPDCETMLVMTREQKRVELLRLVQ